MTALQTRKNALLLESDLNRLRLCAEVQNLREFAGFSKLKHLGRFGGWKWTLASLVGVTVALGVGRTQLAGGLLRKALVAMPAFIRLWRMVSALLTEFR